MRPGFPHRLENMLHRFCPHAVIVTALVLAGCQPGETDDTVFVDITREAGVTFVHFSGMSGEHYFPEIQGPGGALFDYDNDGDLDLYLVQGHMLGPEKTIGDATYEPASPLTGHLYRNDLDAEGNVRFSDVTRASGIEATGFGIGVAAGDYDNDGWVDLYVTHFGDNQLWRNNGDGTFSDVTQSSGATDRRWSHSAAFLDFDRDGWLDLFIVNYVDFRVANHKKCPDATGRAEYCGPNAYPPISDRLYRNRGDGTFENVSRRAGLVSEAAAGLGVVTADLDHNGLIDIYVANDAMQNHLWLNQGDGTFLNDALMRGVAVDNQGRAEASMGVDAGDIDGDGDDDLFMTHLREETNTLYINEGDAQFVERTVSAGLSAASLGLTGFGTAMLDYDNDGWLDLVVVNGEVRAIQTLVRAGHPFPYGQRNQLYRNEGGRFTEIRHGLPPNEDVSRGLSMGDLDNDGDIDLVVFNNSTPPQVLLNTVGNRNHWIGFRLTGIGGRDMYGAQVVVFRQDELPLWRRVRADASYLSANDPRVLVGLGDNTAIDAVEVLWPDGSRERWDTLAPDRYHTLKQGGGLAVNP